MQPPFFVHKAFTRDKKNLHVTKAITFVISQHLSSNFFLFAEYKGATQQQQQFICACTLKNIFYINIMTKKDERN